MYDKGQCGWEFGELAVGVNWELMVTRDEIGIPIGDFRATAGRRALIMSRVLGDLYGRSRKDLRVLVKGLGL